MRRFAITFALLFALPAAGRQAVKTDFRVYPVPPAPQLPAAGGKFKDPTFGTEIMRVTDEKTAAGGSCGTSYSYLHSLASDGSLVLAQCEGRTSGVVFEFDPVTFTLGRTLPEPPVVNGAAFTAEDAWLDRDRPKVLLGRLGNATLAEWDGSTNKVTPFADLSKLLTLGDFIFQLSVSEDGGRFAATVRRSSENYRAVGCMVYDRPANRLLFEREVASFDECRIDLSGRHLTIVLDPQPLLPGTVRTEVVDLDAGTSQKLLYGPPDYAAGHAGYGMGFRVEGEDSLPRLQLRDLNDPHAPVGLYAFGDWNLGLHVSALAGPDKILVSTYRLPGKTAWGPLYDELALFGRDGQVLRLAHTRNTFDGAYYNTPRANVSRDGRFVAFTSNWGVAGGRRDLFVARVPTVTPTPPPTPSATPTPEPSPRPTASPAPTPTPAKPQKGCKWWPPSKWFSC